MKDAFGNTLQPGDYFSYSTTSNRHTVLRVGRVGADGAVEKIAARGFYCGNWSLLNGRPGDTVIRMHAIDVPPEVQAVLA